MCIYIYIFKAIETLRARIAYFHIVGVLSVSHVYVCREREKEALKSTFDTLPYIITVSNNYFQTKRDPPSTDIFFTKKEELGVSDTREKKYIIGRRRPAKRPDVAARRNAALKYGKCVRVRVRDVLTKKKKTARSRIRIISRPRIYVRHIITD